MILALSQILVSMVWKWLICPVIQKRNITTKKEWSNHIKMVKKRKKKLTFNFMVNWEQHSN